MRKKVIKVHLRKALRVLKVHSSTEESVLHLASDKEKHERKRTKTNFSSEAKFVRRAAGDCLRMLT